MKAIWKSMGKSSLAQQNIKIPLNTPFDFTDQVWKSPIYDLLCNMLVFKHSWSYTFCRPPLKCTEKLEAKMSDLVPFEPHAVGQSGFCAHLQRNE